MVLCRMWETFSVHGKYIKARENRSYLTNVVIDFKKIDIKAQKSTLFQMIYLWTPTDRQLYSEQ